MLHAVRFIAAAVCALACLTVRAGDNVDHSLVREKEIQNFTINADGSFVEAVDIVILVREERGAQRAAQQSLYYNGANSTLEVLSAYTQKADGSKLPVTPDNMKDQQASTSINAPRHLDLRVKTLIFPHVEPGDRLVFSTRKTQRQALFAGHFFDLSYASSDEVQQLSINYDLPASLPLYIDNRGFALTKPPAAKDRLRYCFDYVLAPTPRAEANAVSQLDKGPRAFVTTFASFAAFARAYETATAPASARTPSLVAQAERIVDGLAGERAKAEAIAYWVRDNIRPLDVGIGSANTLAPNKADDVIANRYGDARDEVALMRALLGAVGIDSSAALINNGNAYRLADVPSVDLFGQVITYIPSLDLYIDTTERGIAPGFLPEAQLDKPVLLTASGIIAHTPSWQRDQLSINSDFVVSADGAADFVSIVSFDGTNAEQKRASNRGADTNYRINLVEDILRSLGQTGRGDYDVGDTDAASPHYQVRYSGHSEDLAALPGPIGINASSSLRRTLASAVATLASETAREQDFVCASDEVSEQARYQFPVGVRIIALPQPVFLHDDFFDYTATYEQTGRDVWVRRRYLAHHPGRVCTVADFAMMRPSLDRMQRDLRSQLIIQGP